MACSMCSFSFLRYTFSDLLSKEIPKLRNSIQDQSSDELTVSSAGLYNEWAIFILLHAHHFAGFPCKCTGEVDIYWGSCYAPGNLWVFVCVYSYPLIISCVGCTAMEPWTASRHWLPFRWVSCTRPWRVCTGPHWLLPRLPLSTYPHCSGERERERTMLALVWTSPFVGQARAVHWELPQWST